MFNLLRSIKSRREHSMKSSEALQLLEDYALPIKSLEVDIQAIQQFLSEHRFDVIRSHEEANAHTLMSKYFNAARRELSLIQSNLQMRELRNWEHRLKIAENPSRSIQYDIEGWSKEKFQKKIEEMVYTTKLFIAQMNSLKEFDLIEQAQFVADNNLLPEGDIDNFNERKLLLEQQRLQQMNSSAVEVVGTRHYDGLRILRNVVKDLGGIWNVGGYQEHELELTLQPEPDNPYDKNAIAVISEYDTPERARISRSGKIGHLPRNSGIQLSSPIRVTAIVKEGYGNFWIRIDLSQRVLQDLNEG